MGDWMGGRWMDRCRDVWMACLTHIGWAVWLLFLMIPLTFKVLSSPMSLLPPTQAARMRHTVPKTWPRHTVVSDQDWP